MKKKLGPTWARHENNRAVNGESGLQADDASRQWRHQRRQHVIDLVVSGDDLNGLVEGYFTHYRRFISLSRADRLAAQEGDPLSDWLQEWLIWPGPVPEVGWDVVIALLDRAPDENALAFVIAGPLRDLATHHGQQFADRLVERSRRDIEFRRSMTTIYRLQGVPPVLQARLGAVIESDQRVRGPRHSQA